MNIGNAIKQARIGKRLTQKELGDKIGIDSATVGKYERGLINPKIETIKKFAKALNADFAELCMESIAQATESAIQNIEKHLSNTVYKPKPGSDLALLPCPFCGNEDVVYMSYSARDGSSGERWEVLCCYCAAGINPGWARQKSDVRDLWNRRAVNR